MKDQKKKKKRRPTEIEGVERVTAKFQTRGSR